jgi:hypothetical protein
MIEKINFIHLYSFGKILKTLISLIFLNIFIKYKLI